MKKVCADQNEKKQDESSSPASGVYVDGDKGGGAIDESTEGTATAATEEKGTATDRRGAHSEEMSVGTQGRYVVVLNGKKENAKRRKGRSFCVSRLTASKKGMGKDGNEEPRILHRMGKMKKRSGATKRHCCVVTKHFFVHSRASYSSHQPSSDRHFQ